MITYALDSGNDLLIRNGDFATVDEGAQVAQDVRSRLLFYRGEWFLDLNVGVPWFQEVFEKPFNAGLAETIIKNAIIETPGVQNLTRFSMTDPDAQLRRVTVSFSAVTDFGVIDNEEIFINV